MSQLRRILVPVDFSDCSRAALRYACFLADKFDAEVEVFHAFEPPYYVGEVMVQIPGRPSVTVHEHIRAEAEKLLDELVDAVDEASGRALAKTLTSGVPYDAIIARVDDGDIDLVVMGTHGRRGLSHLLMGSVAERVLRQANCPITVVRDEYPARKK